MTDEPTWASEPDVSVVLCDFPQVDPANKLHMIGGGISNIPSMAPHAVALLVRIPWTLTNTPLRVQISLVHEDGRAVEFPGPSGENLPVVIGRELEIGRPAGVKHGSSFVLPFAVTNTGLPLAPGAYRWEVEVDGKRRDHWQQSFNVPAA